MTKIITEALPCVPVITKIFEMILLKKLEDFAGRRRYFSALQFGFKRSVDSLEPGS